MVTTRLRTAIWIPICILILIKKLNKFRAREAIRGAARESTIDHSFEHLTTISCTKTFAIMMMKKAISKNFKISY